MEKAFIAAFNQILHAKERHIASFEKMSLKLSDTSELEQQLGSARAKHADLMATLRRYMEENTRQIQDQTEYNRRFSELDTQCQEAERQIASLQGELLDRQGQKAQLCRSIDLLYQCGDTMEKFDENIWNAMVESATISADGTFAVLFRDGTEVPVKLPEGK